MLRATRDSRRLLSLVVLGIAILVAIRWLTPGDSSREEVRRTLERVLEDVAVRSGETPGRRDQRVQETLARHFADPVTVRYVDMPRTGAGRAALLLWARLLGTYQSAELSMVHFELAREAERALAKIDVRLEAQGSKGSISQERAVEVSLVRRADRWVIESVDVVRGAANLPEARP